MSREILDKGVLEEIIEERICREILKCEGGEDTYGECFSLSYCKKYLENNYFRDVSNKIIDRLDKEVTKKFKQFFAEEFRDRLINPEEPHRVNENRIKECGGVKIEPAINHIEELTTLIESAKKSELGKYYFTKEEGEKPFCLMNYSGINSRVVVNDQGKVITFFEYGVNEKSGTYYNGSIIKFTKDKPPYKLILTEIASSMRENSIEALYVVVGEEGPLHKLINRIAKKNFYHIEVKAKFKIQFIDGVKRPAVVYGVELDNLEELLKLYKGE